MQDMQPRWGTKNGDVAQRWCAQRGRPEFGLPTTRRMSTWQSVGERQLLGHPRCRHHLGRMGPSGKKLLPRKDKDAPDGQRVAAGAQSVSAAELSSRREGEQEGTESSGAVSRAMQRGKGAHPNRGKTIHGKDTWRARPKRARAPPSSQPCQRQLACFGTCSS